MYSNSGYLNDTDIEIEDHIHPLTVTGCGIYRLLSRPVMTTLRPNGRKDYQLLYISAGKAYFCFGAQTKEVPAGNMVLYRPKDPQHYYYYAKDAPEVCWIHFSGRDVPKILDKIGFSDTCVLPCPTSFNWTELFRLIILELQLKRPCFEELLCLNLGRLFAQIHRSQLEPCVEKRRGSLEMESVIHYFNESFSENISIEECARQKHMSVCWFIRSFKRYMGMTPMQYITSIRLNKAKELLRSTDYTIQEISGLVGYENPLYFSRIFRKQTGQSPSQYREK